MRSSLAASPAPPLFGVMAIVKSVNISDFSKELKNLTPELKKEAIDATYSGVLKSQERLNKETPVDTGFLLASWRTEKNPLEPEPSVIIGNDAPYAGVVLEYGAKPHTPPLKPLLEWASRKLKKPIHHPRVRKLAFGVRRKVQRRGVPAKFTLSNAIDDYIIPNIIEEIEKSIGE